MNQLLYLLQEPEGQRAEMAYTQRPTPRGLPGVEASLEEQMLRVFAPTPDPHSPDSDSDLEG